MHKVNAGPSQKESNNFFKPKLLFFFMDRIGSRLKSVLRTLFSCIDHCQECKAWSLPAFFSSFYIRSGFTTAEFVQDQPFPTVVV